MSTFSKRIAIIDALRGFALAGIVLVHMVENYTGAPPHEAYMAGTHAGAADYVVDGIVQILLRGKFFALFSFLFGLSFFIQMDSGAKREKQYALRFLWRVLLLLLIGLGHHFIYRGDILSIYALLGIFLIPFHKVNTKTLLILVALIFLGVGRYLVFALNPDGLLFLDYEMTPNAAAIETYFELLSSGSFWEVGLDNSTEGQLMKMEFQFGIFYRGFLTFAFFLLGLLVGRYRFLHEFEKHLGKLSNLFWAGGIGLVVALGITIAAFSQMGQEFSLKSWWTMFGLTGMDLANISLTLLILAFFVWLFARSRWQKLLLLFAPYGRMALTNYILQSVIGAAIFYGWGLGYLGKIPNRYTFLMGFVIISLQMWISKLWLQKCKYGPLEWLWRSATHGKWYPLLKENK
ncbi:MAG: DUF418 domain-containing protein [Flavobacteriaceae bacterium]|nr:DUF418 domain-containing protein [Flavobacteriaceae bacterium]